MDRWDAFGLKLAQTAADMSYDPSTCVGAAILRPDHTVASLGFNGFPRGVEDSHERLNDRDLKYDLMVHAEVNAILHSREPLRGYTMYCTLPPCSRCAGPIIQVGIIRVVALKPTFEQWQRWSKSLDLAARMFTEANVRLDLMQNDS